MEGRKCLTAANTQTVRDSGKHAEYIFNSDLKNQPVFDPP